MKRPSAIRPPKGGEKVKTSDEDTNPLADLQTEAASSRRAEVIGDEQDGETLDGASDKEEQPKKRPAANSKAKAKAKGKAKTAPTKPKAKAKGSAKAKGKAKAKPKATATAPTDSAAAEGLDWVQFAVIIVDDFNLFVGHTLLPGNRKVSGVYYYKSTNIYGVKVDGREVLQAWGELSYYVIILQVSVLISFRSAVNTMTRRSLRKLPSVPQ